MVDYAKIDYLIIGWVSGFIAHMMLIYILDRFGFF